jgi:hypothetical protein
MHIVRTPAERTYPLLLPPDDRFSDTFVATVADLIAFHGFPFVGGPDLEALGDTLRHFIFGSPWCPGATADLLGECGHAGPHPPHVVLATRTTPLCEVDGFGWCTTHLGFHPGDER